MNYELCTMLTFFRVKSFPVWFLNSVLTSAAYTHHELTVCPVWLWCLCRLSPFKCYQPTFVMVLYCILPLGAFTLLLPAEVGRTHRVLLYLHRLSKEPDWSISRPELMF